MKCEDFEIATIDYLDKNLSDNERKAFEAHLVSCERCSDELKQLQQIYADTQKVSFQKPDRSLQANFNFMLKTEIEKLEASNPTKKIIGNNWQKGILKIAAAFILIVAGTYVGYLFFNQNSEPRLANIEKNSSNSPILLAMLSNESVGERIKAVNMVDENSKKQDPKVLNAIIKVMNTDDNVNVRIAAAYTLSKYIDTPMVRDAMIASLETQSEALVQILLMDLLTEKNEKRAIEPMERIINDIETIDQVKYAAEKNINVLI